jgi:hypothetical protein
MTVLSLERLPKKPPPAISFQTIGEAEVVHDLKQEGTPIEIMPWQQLSVEAASKASEEILRLRVAITRIA